MLRAGAARAAAAEAAVTFQAGDSSSRSHWSIFSLLPPLLGDTATVGKRSKREGPKGRGEGRNEVVVQCPQAPLRKEGGREGRHGGG